MSVDNLSERGKKVIVLLGQAQQERGGEMVAAMWLDGGQANQDEAKGYGVSMSSLARIRPSIVQMLLRKQRNPETQEFWPPRLYGLTEAGWEMFRQLTACNEEDA